MKMLDIDMYIKGLKLTWIRRILKYDSKVVKLLEFSEKVKLAKLAYLGPNLKIKNPFWQEVFSAWNELQKKYSYQDRITPNACTLWNNHKIKIDNQSVIYRNWTSKGVWLINDLLETTGNFLTYQNFQDKYMIKTNYLEYQGLILSIKKYLRSLEIDINNLSKIYGPLQPNTIKIFFKSTKGSKDMYDVLNKDNINLTCETKWSNILNLELNWKHIHSLTFKTTKNSKLQWFQYRIVHRILGTNNYLFKMNLATSDKCSLCSEGVETIEHLFWSCDKTNKLWEDLNQWIFENIEIELTLNLSIVLFGLLDQSNKNYVRNLIILLSKFYIYRTKLSGQAISFSALKNYLKENLLCEKYIFFKNHTAEKANCCWNPWLPILN